MGAPTGGFECGRLESGKLATEAFKPNEPKQVAPHEPRGQGQGGLQRAKVGESDGQSINQRRDIAGEGSRAISKRLKIGQIVCG